MVININGHAIETDNYDGSAVVSDTTESGTSVVRNIVIITQAAYNALTPNSDTIYFIT